MGLEMELLDFGVTFPPSYTPDLLATQMHGFAFALLATLSMEATNFNFWC